jgi:hypothetical protein
MWNNPHYKFSHGLDRDRDRFCRPSSLQLQWWYLSLFMHSLAKSSRMENANSGDLIFNSSHLAVSFTLSRLHRIIRAQAYLSESIWWESANSNRSITLFKERLKKKWIEFPHLLRLIRPSDWMDKIIYKYIPTYTRLCEFCAPGLCAPRRISLIKLINPITG